jgi:hypothetical protein
MGCDLSHQGCANFRGEVTFGKEMEAGGAIRIAEGLPAVWRILVLIR